MAVNPANLNSFYAANYAKQNGGLNDDFMTNAYSQSNETNENPSFTGLNTIRHLNADVYEKTTGLSTGLKFGGAAGLVTAGGFYYFGGDKVTPFKDGKFDDKVLKSVEGDIENLTEKEANKLFTQKEAEILKKYGFKDEEQYLAIKKYVTSEDISKLPKKVTKKLPEDIKEGFDSYRSKVANTELEFQTNLKSVVNQAAENVKSNHFGYQSGLLEKYKTQESLIKGLAEDADKAKLEELIKQNPKAFGIEATEEKEIAKQAKNLVKKYKTREGALNLLKTNIETQEKIVDKIRKTLNAEYAKHWDSAEKSLVKDAPKELKAAVRSFKISKAGKYGLIAAGVGAVLGWMFG